MGERYIGALVGYMERLGKEEARAAKAGGQEE